MKLCLRFGEKNLVQISYLVCEYSHQLEKKSSHSFHNHLRLHLNRQSECRLFFFNNKNKNKRKKN